MINVGNTDLGKSIKILREIKGMSRFELSEAVGVSESHLKKIETGIRNPGIDTYGKIMETLGADIVIKDTEERTVKGDCAIKAQKILMGCTEKQAEYLVKVLEFSAQNISGTGVK